MRSILIVPIIASLVLVNACSNGGGTVATNPQIRVKYGKYSFAIDREIVYFEVCHHSLEAYDLGDQEIKNTNLVDKVTLDGREERIFATLETDSNANVAEVRVKLAASSSCPYALRIYNDLNEFVLEQNTELVFERNQIQRDETGSITLDVQAYINLYQPQLTTPQADQPPGLVPSP